MKRWLLTIICLLFSISVLSQNNLDKEFQDYISEYRNFDFNELSQKKFEHSLAQYSISNLPAHRRDTSLLIVRRDLDFNMQESIYRVILNYVAKDSFLGQLRYRLHVLEKNSEIIGIICETNHPSNINSYFDEEEIEQYIHQHDSLYQTQTNKSNLITDLTKEVSYGYLCGIAPQIKDVKERGNYKFDEIRHIHIFREWLRSYNPELQTYGVDAINTIYKLPTFSISENDKKIKEQDIFLAKHIAKRNSIINTCSGCIIDIYYKVFDNPINSN